MASPANAKNIVHFPEEIVRPEANFSPSLWGDQFINYTRDDQMAENYSRAIEVLKDEVKGMLASADSTVMMETMNLIDTLERLGLSYHFEMAIEEKLESIFNLNTKYEDESYDLYTMALHFRLLRQHGYNISSDIFNRFKADEENFRDSVIANARGLLGLYEAAHVRKHGEKILDDALIFATANLKSIAPSLEPNLRKQVESALMQSLHLGVPRLEACNFISIYAEQENKNESLLKFAKLDYNLVQMLHKQELKEVSRWWRELNLASKLPYARDRLVECFFWATGVYHEPQYSNARIILTKTIIMTSLLDDTYDAYGTIDELRIFTEAIQRWDISEIDRLPQYMKPLYEAVLELFEQLNEELALNGRAYGVQYAIEDLKEMVRCYEVEAKWFIEGYMPTFSEYMEIALVTSTYCYHTTTSLLGMNSPTHEDFEWLSKRPPMLVASLTICRVGDDNATFEVEMERGQRSTGIGGYMKEHGVTQEVAMAKFAEICVNGWKDTNMECLKPFPCTREILTRILNFNRLTDVTYKHGDGYTKPEKLLKPHVMAMLVDSLEIN